MAEAMAITTLQGIMAAGAEFIRLISGKTACPRMGNLLHGKSIRKVLLLMEKESVILELKNCRQRPGIILSSE